MLQVKWGNNENKDISLKAKQKTHMSIFCRSSSRVQIPEGFPEGCILESVGVVDSSAQVAPASTHLVVSLLEGRAVQVGCFRISDRPQGKAKNIGGQFGVGFTFRSFPALSVD